MVLGLWRLRVGPAARAHPDADAGQVSVARVKWRVWKGANGGWVAHELLRVDLGAGPFLVGGELRWAPTWRGVLGLLP